MRLYELKPSHGNRKAAKRVGRGIGSGTGKTSGRGHKGQNSRSGGGVRPGFEGGQMPLYRRLPKRGFNNIFANKYVTIKVSDLNKFENDTVITPELLIETGLIKHIKDGVVVLGNGILEKKLTVRANRFTKTAAEKIQSVGGKVEVIQ